MKLLDQHLETVTLDQLIPHPDNPRDGDLGGIWESLQENGFYGALIAQKATGYILAGNHRYLAARDAGAEELPVFWVDVDDDAARRIMLADNRTSDLASYNRLVLTTLLEQLAESDRQLAGTGYDKSDLAGLLRMKDPYQPLLAPSFDPATDASDIGAADVAKAEAKLEGQFDGEQLLHAVTCPHCFETFYLDGLPDA